MQDLGQGATYSKALPIRLLVNLRNRLMIAKVITSAIYGIDGVIVEVEAEVREGKEQFNIIGLGDNAVKEASSRVQTALKYVGWRQSKEVLVNLAPAELKKEGSGFDLAVALGILVAAGALSQSQVQGKAFFGELSLDGNLKPIRGIVALTIAAYESGVQEVVLPALNLPEARLIAGLQVTGLKTLAQVVAYLKGDLSVSSEINSDCSPIHGEPEKRLSDVRGQELAKRALLIAACGGHNLLMIGPPGCGKSMLAERYATLLPRLTEQERLEVVRIHSVAGADIRPYLAGLRPFRSPHHVISEAGLIGGGSCPRPGEISLAHQGVLFLDEFPEYRRGALEALRAPLENRQVRITRAKASVQFPADFQLVAAMNPCPCGRLGAQGARCLCSKTSIQNYLKKLSQPILDRIDLHVELDSVPLSEIAKAEAEEQVEGGVSGINYRQAVESARGLAYARQGKTNAHLSNKELRAVLDLDCTAQALLEKLTERSGLSARGYFKILKVARTIADLARSSATTAEHLAEALSYRSLDRLKEYCGE